MLDAQNLRKLSCKLTAEPDDYMHSFRRNLDVYIDQKEITLAEIAEQADIPVNTLKSLVYGDSKDCHISTAIKLARVLHISVDELIGAGTISPQTCESIQLVRMLPESFTHFVRWAIHYHYDLLNNKKVSEKSVELMYPDVAENGNIIMTNNFDVADISDFPEEILRKIFMGIEIPCDNYAPHYFAGDRVFIANDRNARESETVIICCADMMWFVKRKEETVNGEKKVNYYSIRDGRFFACEDEIQFVLGYIVKKVPKR